jgi:hypothetical protein
MRTITVDSCRVSPPRNSLHRLKHVAALTDRLNRSQTLARGSMHIPPALLPSCCQLRHRFDAVLDFLQQRCPEPLVINHPAHSEVMHKLVAAAVSPEVETM